MRRFLADTRPLGNDDFRHLWVANIVTVVGAQLTVVAVPLQIYAITQSSLYVGLTGMFGLVPLVGFGLWGGALADVVDRRTILLVTTTGLIATAVLFFAQAVAGLNNVWLLLALFSVQQAFFAVNQPTRSAVLPRILPLAQLPAANSLNMTVVQAGAIVGPLLGGALCGGLQRRPIGDRLRLRGRIGRDLRAARSRVPIRLRHLGAYPGDAAAEVDLAFQCYPREGQRSDRVCGQREPLGGLIAGEEGDSRRANPLAQHGSRRGPTIGADRADDHRVGLGDRGRDRFGQPPLEELQPRRIARQPRHVQVHGNAVGAGRRGAAVPDAHRSQIERVFAARFHRCPSYSRDA